MSENCCVNCKHLKVIISQGGNYRCYKRDLYMDNFHVDCKDFELDEIPLREKERRVWD